MIALANLLMYSEDYRDEERGIQMLERAIKQAGSPLAMYRLARYYLDFGSRSQYHKAVALLERSLHQSEDPAVLHLLSFAVASGLGVRRNIPRAIQLMERALRHYDDPQCMRLLAKLLLLHEEGRCDAQRAVYLYEKVIRITNDAQTMNALGVVFADGAPHFPPNARRAVKWFNRAIEVGNLPSAKHNLAVILTQTHDKVMPDPSRAALLLEEVVEETGKQGAILQLAELYSNWLSVLNYPRAVTLLTRAVHEFNSYPARFSLARMLAFGEGVPAQRATALGLFERHYEKVHDIGSMLNLSEMLWSGTEELPADMERSVSLCKQLCRKTDIGNYVLASMLRYGAPTLPRNLKQAITICEREKADDDHFIMLVHAILLSEDPESNDSDISHAIELFRALSVDTPLQMWWVWLPLSLRTSSVDLPIHGNEHCITESVKRYEEVNVIAKLNLASLLVEDRSPTLQDSEEAVQLLESLIDTRIGDLAALNLGYLLWNEVGGIPQDKERARALFERATEEDNNLVGKVLLANALSEGIDEEVSDADQVAELWRSVEDANKTNAEVSRLSSMLSDQAKEIIRMHSEGQQ
ncbi:hypothetical protein BWQ96_04792 [Gracilariopsis chorda]|uniref:Uncharacterized protein n=1 Tax=Gracilariopsis chorda TaxID=448386 RepID=A0A2V3ITQ7_9FLOR|nr:hypothetical protein BWQ96_04792 [Gracilariopsis chorda]|eukprot:PXF45494.1 hypothetical protein BWQ96_04792 [Gracilariopsis chorda]